MTGYCFIFRAVGNAAPVLEDWERHPYTGMWHCTRRVDAGNPDVVYRDFTARLDRFDITVPQPHLPRGYVDRREALQNPEQGDSTIH